MISGVYRIVNIINKKFYIGSTKDFDHRWEKQHKLLLNKNQHVNPYLQKAWNKYGEQNFKFEIIERCPPQQCLLKEQYYLDILTPWNENIGYNLSKVSGGGDKISYHPNLEEIKKKQSANTKRRWNKKTDQEKVEYSNNLKRDKNPNWRGGASIVYCVDCGKKISPYHKRCVLCSKMGKNNPFYGKKHSQKTKEKISVSHIGKKLSEQSKEKCKQASMNFYQSEDGAKYKKEKSKQMSGEKHHLYGIGHTKETVEKMKRLAKERIKNETLEEKIFKKCRLGYNILRFEDKFYLSYELMSEALKESKTSLRFKCRHKSQKWKNYEEIKLSLDIPKEQIEFYLNRIKENGINFSH